MTEMTVRAQKAAGGMLALTASAHFLNDMIQSVIPASIRCHSGEYTLSENYVHGLAAFGPRLKNFESPHSSRGSSPGLPAGNSVKRAWCRIKSYRKILPNSKQTRPCPCRERKRRRKNQRKTKSLRRLKRPKNRRKKTPRLNRFPPYRHRRTGVFLRCLSQPPQQ